MSWLARLLLTPVLVLNGGCGAPSNAPPAPINVVLITVDTLRADHLSGYGYGLPTSPHIDRLAGQGARFENAVAQRGGTWPSLTSLLTSQYPYQHGVRANGQTLGESVFSIAQLLKPHGYATAAFLANMTTAPNRGFDVKLGFDATARDEKAAAAAIEWLRKRGAEPFFLWLHLFGPHTPYEPSPEYAARFAVGYRGALDASHLTLTRIHAEKRELTELEHAHIVSLYDGAIAEVDERVGTVLSVLDDLDLADRTLVVFTSDHGEELYDHDRYFLHSWSIHGTVLHVPLLMRLPGALPAGRTIETVVESVDVAPTIFALAGLEPHDEFAGRSLVPDMTAAPPPRAPEHGAISELGPYIYSLRTERWHFISNPRGLSSPAARPRDRGALGFFSIPKEALYDLEADPGETRDVLSERPEIAATLRERLATWVRERGAIEFEATELPEETYEELKALGYVD